MVTLRDNAINIGRNLTYCRSYIEIAKANINHSEPDEAVPNLQDALAKLVDAESALVDLLAQLA